MSEVRITATAWIDSFEVEGDACVLDAERSDTNEIALHVILHDETSAATSVYLTDAEAARLMMVLGRAVLSDA